MTISSTTRVAGPFVGSGSTATFPFTFKVFVQADLYVTELDVATGAISTLALTTDYTVALNEDQDSDPGGSITLTGGNLATGFTLTITSDVAQLQGVELSNGGAFYPDVINDALDRLTILVQQLQVGMATLLSNMRVAPCDLTTPYTVYTAPGNVAAVFVNGYAQASSSYTAAGPVITFTYVLDPGDQVDALCTT